MNAPHPQQPQTLRNCALFSWLLVLLAGCATPGGSPSTGGGAGSPLGGAGAAPSASPVPAPVSPLVSERHWLEEWFRGTPVLIGMADINTLTVDVPLANSFDAGKSAVKPALAAVLERVATSLRRQAQMRVSIAAPSDPNAASAALANTRAQQVRDFLVTRGVPVTRMSGVGTARSGAAVQLRLVTVPQAIGRLDDASLPPPSAGIKPVGAAPVSAGKR